MPTRATAHGTTTPDEVVTVTLDLDAEVVEVANRSTEGTIWFTLNGTAPVAGAANVEVVPAGSALEIARTGNSPTVVKLVSAEAVDYSVAGARR